MALWTLRGLAHGRATTRWPEDPKGNDGQNGTLGMPKIVAERLDGDCRRAAQVCPTEAIRVDADGHLIGLDYGRCIGCQLCVEACPSGALQASEAWAFGARERADLQWTREPQPLQRKEAKSSKHIGKQFRGSLHIRHVDAGSCNACESELQALNNPFYNLHRLGIFFTPSPRAADLLLVTGPVTAAMREPLLATWQAMPEPRMVMACGTCAVSGGICGGTYASGTGLGGVLPVDIWLPGSPPNPAAIIEALLLLLDRVPQRVHGGIPDAS